MIDLDTTFVLAVSTDKTNYDLKTSNLVKCIEAPKGISNMDSAYRLKQIKGLDVDVEKHRVKGNICIFCKRSYSLIISTTYFLERWLMVGRPLILKIEYMCRINNRKDMSTVIN